MNKYCILHGQQSVSYAVLESLYQVYKEIEQTQTQSSVSFENIMIACGQACCVAELVLANDDVDHTLMSMPVKKISLAVFHYTVPSSGDVAALKLLDQLHQDMQEFIFNGTTIVLPELIRLFECSNPSILELHEELEALCIDINLARVRDPA